MEDYRFHREEWKRKKDWDDCFEEVGDLTMLYTEIKKVKVGSEPTRRSIRYQPFPLKMESQVNGHDEIIG